MSHQVQVNSSYSNSSYSNVQLPDGFTYTGPVVVTLTDTQYALLTAHSFDSGVLTEPETEEEPVPEPASAE